MCATMRDNTDNVDDDDDNDDDDDDDDDDDNTDRRVVATTGSGALTPSRPVLWCSTANRNTSPGRWP